MRTVNVAGANLYAVALQYLGDATQWNRIAQANGLIDPMVVGTATLQIPSVDLNAGGGIFVPAK
jgi:nucleoid-associated protein YgaU